MKLHIPNIEKQRGLFFFINFCCWKKIFFKKIEFLRIFLFDFLTLLTFFDFLTFSKIFEIFEFFGIFFHLFFWGGGFLYGYLDCFC